jgi:redox-sensitive bicupin YhaK (pirin superfamily)
LRLVGSKDGRDGSIVIHQDAKMYDALLRRSDTATHELVVGRKAWIQVLRGAIDVNGKPASAGDGVATENEMKLIITSRTDGSEILLFDLP